MFPLSEKREESYAYQYQKRDIALNLSHCSKEFILKLVEDFYGRYSMEKMNGFLFLVVRNVNYDEFATLVAGYSYWLETGKFHMIFEPPLFPTCKILLTSREK